jgi:hypothetical protein
MFPRFPVVMFSRPHALPLLPMSLPCSFPKLISRLSQPLRDRSIRQRGNGSGVWGSVLLLLLLAPPTLSLTLGHIMPRCVSICRISFFLRRRLSASSPRRLIYPENYPLRLWMILQYCTCRYPLCSVTTISLFYGCSTRLLLSFALSIAALCWSRQPTSCAMILISHIPTPRITVQPKRLVGLFLLARRPDQTTGILT